MKNLTKATIFLVLVLLASCNYSTGERTGTITKFSYKGNIWKTYEGELLQGGLKSDSHDRMQANVFEFSLDADRNNKAIIDTINKAIGGGLPVRLFYTEEILTNCSGSRGSTNYFITDIKIIYN